MKREADKIVIEELKKQMLNLHKSGVSADQQKLGLGEIETAFPGEVFPRAAVHELISHSPEESACTSGFISLIAGKLMQQGGACLWISSRRNIFPPALKTFGIEPDRILFVDAKKTKDISWILEEGLKCDALSTVVGELSELSFQESRRLQLTVERSRVTGFIHRYQPKAENTVTCVSRWKIKPLASITPGSIPGLGFPAWNVQLLKARNGKPGEWQIQWSPAGLSYLHQEAIAVPHLYTPQTA